MNKNMERFFNIHGQPPPQRQFGEGPEAFRTRCLSLATCLLKPGHVLQGVPVHRQPASALPGLEAILYDQAIAAHEAPRGELREEVMRDRTGREIVHFFGSPEEAWKPFKGEPRRATFTSGLGRGADSPAGRAQAQARAEALQAAGL